MSTQAIPAIVYRTRSHYRSLDRWGLFVSLAIIGAALSGVLLGFVTAGYFAAGFLILGAALPVAAYGLRDPGVGLIGLSVLVTVQNFLQATAFSGSTPLPHNTLNYFLVAFCVLNARRILYIRDLQGKLHLLLVAVMACGLLWSANAYPLGVLQVFYVSAGFGLIVYFEILPPSEKRMLFWTAISSSAVASIVGFLQYQDASVTSEFNANGMGTMQVNALFTVFLAVFAKVVKRREMNVLLLLGAVNLTYAFFSGSRGSISTAVFLWLCILVWGVSLSRKLAYAGASIIIAAGLGSLSPQFQDYAQHRLNKTFDSSQSIASRSSGRSEIAMIGWKLFRENPMGIGTGAFLEASTRVYDRDFEKFYSHGHVAHSAWVQVLAENGVIGAFVLIVYVASFTWTGFLKRRYPGLLPAGLAVSGAIAVRYLAIDFTTLGIFWLVGGAIFLFHKLPRTAPIPGAVRRIHNRRSFRPYPRAAAALQK